jgi:ring-1,2-phenylacetyl-CoA epoxidase subunit PaaE
LSFHPLRVAAVDAVAADATCVPLEIPPELREAYAFRAGQYVTVRRMIENREERRTYSIVTPPGHGILKLGVRKQAGGRLSGELAQKLRPGELLDTAPPWGDSHRHQRRPRALYVAFGAVIVFTVWRSPPIFWHESPAAALRLSTAIAACREPCSWRKRWRSRIASSSVLPCTS